MSLLSKFDSSGAALSLVARVFKLMAGDDTDDSARIEAAYLRADADGKKLLDDVFISLCGYSLATLLGPSEEENDT
jgi:hypothetical protein